jgi:hypothetical protein
MAMLGSIGGARVEDEEGSAEVEVEVEVAAVGIASTS